MRMQNGLISHLRIALTNLGPTALRAEAAEKLLLGKPLDEAAVEAASQAAMAICDPAEDLRGDVEYKTAMARQMVKRALVKAHSRCA
jgi:carbon-monoxide dehydrogenase medium subunit